MRPDYTKSYFFFSIEIIYIQVLDFLYSKEKKSGSRITQIDEWSILLELLLGHQNYQVSEPCTFTSLNFQYSRTLCLPKHDGAWPAPESRALRTCTVHVPCIYSV